MRVKRDFDAVYAADEDPWAIGDADSERYERYRELLLSAAVARRAILDVGSGFGAFLARFEGEFESLHAVELSAEAVSKGGARFPFIEFEQGSAEDLAATRADQRHFDSIIVSDLVYYLGEKSRRRLLSWVADHLSDDGVALIAAWCPGGDYLTAAEFRRLVQRPFALIDEQRLESGHLVFVARPKRRLAALTLDYETWQPLLPGLSIDWEKDVFEPTAGLLDVLDAAGARMTIFAECGEWFWLRENEPELAARWEEQLRDARRRGHDVQLHLHPHWLPELGARREGERWIWDESLARAADYPGDLTELIGRCKELIEETLRPVDPGYRVTCFRAGGYEAQPFARLYEALAANGIGCDSSVYPGGRHPDRGYDYGLAYSRHQPYFAGRTDPQLKAPPAERAIVELPVMTLGFNDRWTFDSDQGGRFARRLLDWRAQRDERAATTEQVRRRREFGRRLGNAYARAKPFRRALNQALPRRLARTMTSYEPEVLAQDEYYVLVGHSKTNLDIEAIGRGVRELIAAGFELRPLAELAELARAELDQTVSADPQTEAAWQVEREYTAMMSDERNEAQSFRLQELVPYDCERILDYGCGSGTWSARLAELRPWATVIGIDVGEDFIAKARADHGSERVRFKIADFTATGFDDASFDCVYADNSLEHAFDVDATLSEIARVLRDGGVLCAAIPPDARNPGRICDNHTWKTAPHDVRLRLEQAGFSDISIEEVDIYRELGMAPFPPSDDRMMYIRAWKRSGATTVRTRAEEIATWVYERLSPERPSHSGDFEEVLRGGFAWCAGYNLVTGRLLEGEGYGVTWISMEVEGHPRGRGTLRSDSHEVLEVTPPGGGRACVLDPMSNLWFDATLDQLVADPELAGRGRVGDARWQERGYELYSSAAFYACVRRVARRRQPVGEPEFVPVR
jgi:SAM-dependent methyltransferase